MMDSGGERAAHTMPVLQWLMLVGRNSTSRNCIRTVVALLLPWQPATHLFCLAGLASVLHGALIQWCDMASDYLS